MKNSYIKLFITATALVSMVTGCNSTKQNLKSDKIGYFVSPINSHISYQCGDIEKELENNGKFICSSFPISFYSDTEKLGSISSLHNDKYVFLQDITLEKTEPAEPTYTKLAYR